MDAEAVLPPPPQPRSPPRIPDLCGRQRLQAHLHLLRGQIAFLEVRNPFLSLPPILPVTMPMPRCAIRLNAGWFASTYQLAALEASVAGTRNTGATDTPVDVFVRVQNVPKCAFAPECLCCISYCVCKQRLKPSKAGRPLPVRSRLDRGVPSLADRGLPTVRRDSRLRRRSCLTAAISCSAEPAAGALADRKLRQNVACRTMASSGEIRSRKRQISSCTASAQRPQIHRPPCRSRTPAIYAGVHSSVIPQQSHAANSTSSPPAIGIPDMKKKRGREETGQESTDLRERKRRGSKCYLLGSGDTSSRSPPAAIAGDNFDSSSCGGDTSISRLRDLLILSWILRLLFSRFFFLFFFSLAATEAWRRLHLPLPHALHTLSPLPPPPSTPPSSLPESGLTDYLIADHAFPFLMPPPLADTNVVVSRPASSLLCLLLTSPHLLPRCWRQIFAYCLLSSSSSSPVTLLSSPPPATDLTSALSSPYYGKMHCHAPSPRAITIALLCSTSQSPLAFGALVVVHLFYTLALKAIRPLSHHFHAATLPIQLSLQLTLCSKRHPFSLTEIHIHICTHPFL
ncbi:hypothetical protein ZIOFF_051849 [Zingiber officinale]|uniref:Uncharacterized protein n=1 Tax=Zingiber officinale TaxID=94328 RepID=A0A8J5FRT1_ZINOF|nr:hypothetical protein ZIOFF_051849 [Zingiber officinale]